MEKKKRRGTMALLPTQAERTGRALGFLHSQCSLHIQKRVEAASKIMGIDAFFFLKHLSYVIKLGFVEMLFTRLWWGTKFTIFFFFGF